jgi:hypothetical protein
VSERTDERTAEPKADAEEIRSNPEDQVAERFLELEAELKTSPDVTLPDGAIRRGQIVDAHRVPTDEISDGYPVSVGSGQALVLTVDVVGTGKVQTYLDWPSDGEPGAESTLGRLLDSLGVDPDRLASLYGQEVLVEVVDSAYTVYVPSESPRGTDRTTGIAASLGASLATLVGAAVASGTLSALLLVVFFLVTFVVLPYETYRDGWYLRTHSDWEGGPVFWTVLAMIPLVNVLSTAMYLSGRRNATMFGE